MSLPRLAGSLTALILSATAVAAQQSVNFISLDAKTNLTAHLSRPAGDAPRPAVVMMHGCSGYLNSKGRTIGLYRA